MLNKTPLAETHEALGGKMVDFGGWWMPVNYGSQIEEHHAVRNSCGIFDVSHMTVVDVKGDDAKAFLQILLANDVDKLKSPGKALYTGMLNEQGGVIDDLIVYLMPWGYRMVVNCATREKDLAWITQQASRFAVEIIEQSDMAMVAVQGPKARQLFSGVCSSESERLLSLKVFSGINLSNERAEWFVARTGYTGEDGFEVMLPSANAAGLWQALVAAGATPCGLGARDTLRLEAGMNLYSHEMNDTVSPLVANMAWTIAWQPDARKFIGRAALEAEKNAGVDQQLVGLVMKTRGVLRDGYAVVIEGYEPKGVVTSGTFSPTLGCSIALARIPKTSATQAQVIIRNKAVAVDIVKPCFVRNGKALVS